jgi:hypothetical protein
MKFVSPGKNSPQKQSPFNVERYRERLVRTYDAERMWIVQGGMEKQDLLGADA